VNSTATATSVRRHEGNLRADGFRFAIVVSRFNDFITGRLLESAIEGLRRFGAADDAIEVYWVPGAFELPLAAQKAATSGRFHAILCLGLLLKGETPHFEYISQEVTRGIGHSALSSGIPHTYGVLTCNTLEEAIHRAGVKAGNKGWEAAMAAVEMASLFAETDAANQPGRASKKAGR